MFGELDGIDLPGVMGDGSQFGNSAELLRLLSKWNQLATWTSLATCRHTLVFGTNRTLVEDAARHACELDREHDRISQMVLTHHPEHYGKVPSIDALVKDDVLDIINRRQMIRYLIGVIIATLSNPANRDNSLASGIGALCESVDTEVAPATSVVRKTKGKNVEGGMLKLLADNSNAIDWPSTEWARRLACSDGTIRQTKTWKELILVLREQEKAARPKSNKHVNKLR